MRFLAFIIPAILALLGCTNKLLIADEAFIMKNMPYVSDNQSRREDILLKLGEPNWSFEDGRILTFRIIIDKKGKITPVTNDNNKNARDLAANSLLSIRYYSLVLVFNPQGILQKHSLILTNP